MQYQQFAMLAVLSVVNLSAYTFYMYVSGICLLRATVTILALWLSQ